MLDGRSLPKAASMLHQLVTCESFDELFLLEETWKLSQSLHSTQGSSCFHFIHCWCPVNCSPGWTGRVNRKVLFTGSVTLFLWLLRHHKRSVSICYMIRGIICIHTFSIVVWCFDYKSLILWCVWSQFPVGWSHSPSNVCVNKPHHSYANVNMTSTGFSGCQ